MALVANVWHVCHSQLFVIIESSRRFAITELREVRKRIKILDACCEGLQCMEWIQELRLNLMIILSEK